MQSSVVGRIFTPEWRCAFSSRTRVTSGHTRVTHGSRTGHVTGHKCVLLWHPRHKPVDLWLPQLFSNYIEGFFIAGESCPPIHGTLQEEAFVTRYVPRTWPVRSPCVTRRDPSFPWGKRTSCLQATLPAACVALARLVVSSPDRCVKDQLAKTSHPPT